MYIKIIAKAKPNKGESNNACPISMTLSQFKAAIPLFESSGKSACPTPIPIIEPIKVCELEAGMPKYQVPRFHKIAEINKERAIAIEW